jgi:hypothetical protein
MKKKYSDDINLSVNAYSYRMVKIPFLLIFYSLYVQASDLNLPISDACVSNFSRDQTTNKAPAYHLIAYSSLEYISAGNRLLASAKLHSNFTHVRLYTPDDLDALFEKRNSHILSQKRGGGYWIYKPYILLYHLTNVAEAEDIIVYFDAMYEFIGDIKSFISEWIIPPPHIAVVSNKPYTSTFIEKQWSKRDAFLLMGINETDLFTESHQLWAGFVAFKNTFYGVQYLAEWLTYVQDVRIVDDSPSKISGYEDPDFYENRHDQTILSLLAKKWNIAFHLFPEDIIICHKPTSTVYLKKAEKY